MQRQGFLQIFGALAAGTAIPMLAATPAVPTATVWNATTLATAMDSMFNSRLGPAAAYFELTKNDGVKYAELVHAMGEPQEILRVTYQTFAVGIEGGTAEEAEAQLAEHFYNEFQRYAADKPLMYWRRKPEFQSAEVVTYGDTFLTAEQIEDEVWRFTDVGDPIVRKTAHGHMVNTQRRHFDANAKLVLPPDVEMDFSTGNYKYVTKRVQLHKMSMRLAIPRCWGNKSIEQIAHAEGATVTRI